MDGAEYGLSRSPPRPRCLYNFGQFELDGGGCGQLQLSGGRIQPPFGPESVVVKSLKVRLRNISGLGWPSAAAPAALLAVMLPPLSVCDPCHR